MEEAKHKVEDAIESTWNLNVTKRSLNDVLKKKGRAWVLVTGSGSLVGLYKGYVKGRTDVKQVERVQRDKYG